MSSALLSTYLQSGTSAERLAALPLPPAICWHETDTDLFYQYDRGRWVPVVGVPASLTPPGGTANQLQVNNQGAFGGLASGTLGQILTSGGPGVLPVFQGFNELVSISATGALDNVPLDPTRHVHVIVCSGSADSTFSGTTTSVAPNPGDRLIVIAQGTGTVYLQYYKTALSQYPLHFVPTSLTAGLPLVGSFQGRAEFIFSPVLAAWLLQHYEQGMPMTVPYAAANYGASSGTWTTTSVGQSLYAYYILGRTARLSVAVSGGSLSAAAQYLTLAWPFSFAYSEWGSGFGGPTGYSGAAPFAPVMVGSSINTSALSIYPGNLTGSTWTVNSSGTGLVIQGSFVLQ